MTSRRALLLLLLSTAGATACGTSDEQPLVDAGLAADSGSVEDATTTDAIATDATATPDAGTTEVDGGGARDSGGGASDSGVTLGQAIEAPPGAWTWVDFPDSHCDDGSPTGIAVNTSTRSQNLLIFMNGGGACWDFLTCFTLNTAAHGPFGAAEFARLGNGIDVGIFKRNEPANPFRDYSFVFVPYCTGDVHGGNNMTAYTQGGVSRPYYHTGHANLLGYLERLGATFPGADKVVMSGSSAGGFGAVFNYAAVRAYWATSTVYLVDDSGPPLVGDAIPPSEKTAWFASWKIDELLDPLCGEPCKTDFSLGLVALSTMFPNDRLSLLSSLQDQVIRTYFMQSGAGFQTELLKLSTDVLDPLPNFRYFFIPGQSHTMLGSPEAFNSNGVQLWDWLRAQVEDEPVWESTKP